MAWKPPTPEKPDNRPSERGKPRAPRSPQPALDKLLSIGLTPHEIYESCIEHFDTAWTAYESAVDEDLVICELLTRNDRTGNTVRMVTEEWTEEDTAQPESEREFKTMFTVELKIGIALISSTWMCDASPRPARSAPGWRRRAAVATPKPWRRRSG